VQYERTPAQSVDLPWSMGEMTKMKLKMPSSKGNLHEFVFFFVLGTLAFEGNRERFHAKWRKPQGALSFIEDRLTKEKSEANY